MSAHGGGPAFPTSNGGSPDDGMSLRDYFAAKALLGFLACDLDVGSQKIAEAVAKGAYLMADAMLKARQS